MHFVQSFFIIFISFKGTYNVGMSAKNLNFSVQVFGLVACHVNDPVYKWCSGSIPVLIMGSFLSEVCMFTLCP